MNESHVMLNDSVSLACSVTYRTQIKLKVTLTLREASRTINVTTSTTSPAGEGHCSVSATVRATRSEFGPFSCLAVFTQADSTVSTDELANNSVQLQSSVIPTIQPACTLILFWPTLHVVTK